MEERLVPVNAIIGLVTADGLNRPVLAEAGFQVAGLEVPCLTPQGTVVVDVVLAHPRTAHVLACEAKSGSNVEPDQARRYQVLDARTVVRSAFVTLKERVDPEVEVIYAAVSDNKDRVLLGLREVGAQVPVLVVYPHQITLENSEFASPPLRGAFASPLTLSAPPGRFIPFDHESSNAEIEPYVKAALVAALSQRLQMISIAAVTERAAPHYVLYAVRTQGRLRRKVGEAAQRIAAADPATFEYCPALGNHEAFIRLLRSPEENDPRGRTQGYQRLARQSQRGPRPRRPEIPGQGSLLDELEKADASEEPADSEEEEAEDTP